MSQPVLYLLLFLALVLPVPGAIAIRLLGRRFGERAVLIGAAALFALATGSALALARANVESLSVGDLTLILPATRRGDALPPPPDAVAQAGPTPPDGSAAPPASNPAAPAGPTTAGTAEPSAAPLSTATRAPTASPEPSATPAPTATAEATATAEPTATALPPTATPVPPTATPPPAASEPRRYTVQPGDTLVAIAQRFDVTVGAILRANNLTPAQADSLRPGQELIIPSP